MSGHVCEDVAYRITHTHTHTHTHCSQEKERVKLVDMREKHTFEVSYLTPLFIVHILILFQILNFHSSLALLYLPHPALIV